MKRCPECRRDYYDDSLLYCLEDGAALVQGSVPSPDEPATAILHDTARPSEAATRAQIHATGAAAEPQTKSGAVSERQSVSAHRAAKPLMTLTIAVVILVAGFFGYRYIKPAVSGPINSIAV